MILSSGIGVVVAAAKRVAASSKAWRRRASAGIPAVQPGTWVTLLTGHMGDTPSFPSEGLSKSSAWFGWSCNPRSEATRLQLHLNHAGREG